MVDRQTQAVKAMNAYRRREQAAGWLFAAPALIGFLAWGFSGAGHGWAMSWICFLAIPLYYSLIEAIFKRKPQDFAYPVLAAAVYIIFGFCGICGGWAMGWTVFLTIPIYYFICTLIHKH